MNNNASELTVEQALNNLAIFTSEIKATRQEHVIIQASLQKIGQFIQEYRTPSENDNSKL